MAMRILALLPEVQGARACLNAARAAASVEPDATVEAFHVRVDPDQLVRAPEEVAIQHLRERDEGTAEDRAQAVRQVYGEWLNGLGEADRAQVSWREVVGAEQEQVMREAQGATLLVLARPQDMDAGDALHAAIFETHRPLLVPADWTGEGPGIAKRIAIAWLPTNQARHAVQQARPWLQAAGSVVVVLVEELGRAADDTEISSLLSEFGVRHETKVVEGRGREPGEALLQAVKTLGADAIVMGAYRHNEWIEWALGGTTRHVLTNAHVPLLLAH